jgi:hypothetical protein
VLEWAGPKVHNPPRQIKSAQEKEQVPKFNVIITSQKSVISNIGSYTGSN